MRHRNLLPGKAKALRLVAREAALGRPVGLTGVRARNNRAMSGLGAGKRSGLIHAIAVGGFVAGSFDLIAAFISFGWGVPRAIAGGLLGRPAFQGGTATWILGVVLHYFIAYSAAAAYCLTSQRLSFLKEHFLICGMFFGMGFFLVMNLIVLPLSGLHAMGPYQLRGLIQGILIHMILIGVPIAYCARKFAR